MEKPGHVGLLKRWMRFVAVQARVEFPSNVVHGGGRQLDL
jgi:hypothetical protein